MYQPINPIVGRPGYFQAFLTASYEAVRESVKGALVARAEGPVCERCDGYGVYVGERVGCEACHGRGVIV